MLIKIVKTLKLYNESNRHLWTLELHLNGKNVLTFHGETVNCKEQMYQFIWTWITENRRESLTKQCLFSFMYHKWYWMEDNWEALRLQISSHVLYYGMVVRKCTFPMLVCYFFLINQKFCFSPYVSYLHFPWKNAPYIQIGILM